MIKYGILFLGSILIAQISFAQTVVELAEPAQSFDRAKLIPLDEALPEKAKPPKPVYSSALANASETIKPTEYVVVYESITQTEAFPLGSQNTTSTHFQKPAESTLGNAPQVWQTVTTASGESLYLPVNVPWAHVQSSPYYAPSRASYRIIERR